MLQEELSQALENLAILRDTRACTTDVKSLTGKLGRVHIAT